MMKEENKIEFKEVKELKPGECGIMSGICVVNNTDRVMTEEDMKVSYADSSREESKLIDQMIKEKGIKKEPV